MNREDIIRMAREAGLPETANEGVFIVNSDDLGRILAAEREACARVCHDKAWELKERAMKETVKTQRARLTSEAVGWHDAFTAIRARGQP